MARPDVFAPSPDQLPNLVERYLQLNTLIATYTDELDLIKAVLRHLDPGKHPTDAGTVVVTVARTFNAAEATRILSDEMIAQISETKISPAKAKQVLPPFLYSTLTTASGQPRVSVTA